MKAIPEGGWLVAGRASPKEKAHGVEHGPWYVLDRGNVVATVGDGCADRGTADLIAAAPEMAQLLLRLQDAYGANLDSTSYLSERDVDEIRAVLRKAGVLP